MTTYVFTSADAFTCSAIGAARACVASRLARLRPSYAAQVASMAGVARAGYSGRGRTEVRADSWRSAVEAAARVGENVGKQSSSDTGWEIGLDICLNRCVL